MGTINRKPKILELSDLQEWLLTTELLYARDGNKKLVTIPLGGFRIYQAGEMVWQGIQPYAAVEKYNSL